MPFSTQERYEAIALYTGATSAAPSVTILAEMETEFDAGASFADLSAGIVASDEFTADFPEDLSNEEFAEQWITSVVGDFIDEDAMDWAVDWATGKLNSGVSRGDVVLEALIALAEVEEDNDAWITASTAFENKVEVAEYYVLDLEGDDQLATDRKALIADVDETEESVQAAKDAADDGDTAPATLAQALEDLATANENLSEFLVSALDNESVATKAGAAAQTATAADIQAALVTETGNVDAALETIGTIDAGQYEAAGTATKAAMVADGRDDAAEAIEAAEDDVTDEETTAGSDVVEAIEAVNTAVETYEAALAAEEDAISAETGEFAAYNATNAAADAITVTDGFVNNGSTVELGGATIATLTDGEWDVDEDFNFGGSTADAASFADLTGFDEYMDAAQARTTAELAEASAMEDLEAAVAEVLAEETGEDVADTATEAGDVITVTDGEVALDYTAPTTYPATEAQAVVDAHVALQGEQAQLVALNEAVDVRTEVAELAVELGTLQTAVSDAEAVLADDLEVNLLAGGDNFTADSDVTVFDAEDGDQILTDFGDEGEDSIFFGEGFTLTEIPEDDDITDDVGDQNELEILWTQDDDDLVLYIEGETFGGNSGSTADITTVTLVGVSAEDVTFEGGFLSAGSAG